MCLGNMVYSCWLVLLQFFTNILQMKRGFFAYFLLIKINVSIYQLFLK